MDTRIHTVSRKESLKGAFDLAFTEKPDPYGYLTSSYERRKHERLWQTLSQLSKNRPGGRFHRALEIGCAEGIFTERLVNLADSLVAVDISSVAIRRTSERFCGNPAVSVREANIFESQPDGPFDIVLCSETLYYDPALDRKKLERLADSLASRLSLDGRLILCNHFYTGVDPHSQKTRIIRRVFSSHPALRRERDRWWPFYLISVFRKEET